MMHFDPCIPPFPRISNPQIPVILSLVLTFYILANLVASAAYALMYGPLGMTFLITDILRNRSSIIE
jgi:hypothetical protein